MRTNRLLPAHTSIATRLQHWWWGGGHQVNKSEEVSSLGHQMSLRGGALYGGGLYSEVECIMGNGHMGPPMNRQTDKH